MQAQNQDLAVREDASQLPSGFEAIEPRHAYVHEDQVWFQRAGLLDGVLTIDGFAANLMVGLISEKRPNPFTNQLIIVYDQEPHQMPRYKSLREGRRCKKRREGSPRMRLMKDGSVHVGAARVHRDSGCKMNCLAAEEHQTESESQRAQVS